MMEYEIIGGPMDGLKIELPDQTRTVKFPIPSVPTPWYERLEPIFHAVECEVDPRGIIVWPKET